MALSIIYNNYAINKRMNKEIVLYVLHLISYFLCDRLIVTIGCFGYMCWEGSNLYIKRVEGPNI